MFLSRQEITPVCRASPAWHRSVRARAYTMICISSYSARLYVFGEWTRRSRKVLHLQQKCCICAFLPWKKLLLAAFAHLQPRLMQPLAAFAHFRLRQIQPRAAFAYFLTARKSSPAAFAHFPSARKPSPAAFAHFLTARKRKCAAFATFLRGDYLSRSELSP